MKSISKTTILNHVICRRLACLDSNQYSPDFFTKDGNRVDDAAANFFGAEVTKISVTSDVLISSFTPNKRFAQLTLEGNNAKIRVDIGWFDSDEKFHFIEVKSGKHSDENIAKHLSDIAAQIAVIKHIRPDIVIGTASLALLNGNARGIKDNKLFICTDLTGDALENANDFNINQIIKDISSVPDPIFCKNCRSCEHRFECFPQLPKKHSILNISSLSFNKLEPLFNQNILDAKKIPDDMLSETQQRFVKAWQSKKPLIDKDVVDDFLTKTDSENSGVHFLDFEVISPALPWFDNHSPHTLLPFQFALITTQSGDASTLRYDFLHDGQDDPSSHFADALIEKLCSDNFPIVIYTSYENTIINNLKARFPDKKKKLSLIAERFCDLEKCVRKGYIHPDANGKSSIKIMLPICVPEMTYNNLNIQNGGDAIEGWDNYRKCQDTKEREKLRKDLIDYCHQDSLAMLKMLEKIRQDCPKA